MKYPFVLTLIACCAFLTVSQTPGGASASSRCSLKPAQAPEIRGIRLGMSAEQLLSLFPESSNQQSITAAIRNSKSVESYGVSRFELRPEYATPNPRFEGVNYIHVELLDTRITSFQIEYKGFEWETVSQFVGRLSEGLRLPIESWDSGASSSHMTCDGFRIDAYANRGSTQSIVRVVDTSTPQIVEDRRAAAREKVRQTFKP